MNFKLQYQTSDTTPFEPHEVIANIQIELGDKDYIIEQVNDRSVTFKDNPWRLQFSGAPARLDGGRFVITDDPVNGRTVTLYFFVAGVARRRGGHSGDKPGAVLGSTGYRRFFRRCSYFR